MISTLGELVGKMHFITSALCSSKLYVEKLTSSTPRPDVALACGSASIRRTLFSNTPSADARLTAVVVLPTPPFWFATPIIFAININLIFKNTIF